MKTFLKARWQDLVMVNYTVPDTLLKPYLPFGVELDYFEGNTYVSLVGFRFLRSRIFNCPIPVYGSFDEINLRFYVKRKEGNEYKRGCVFISEVVPYKAVAYFANRLYKEHYHVSSMCSEFLIDQQQKTLRYTWEDKGNAYGINAVFENTQQAIHPGSLEDFIYEHYYGYTKVSPRETWEYKVNHPPWQTNPLISCVVACDFAKMYGVDFAFLNDQQPVAVFNAIGSEISIDWAINKLTHEAGKETIPSR